MVDILRGIADGIGRAFGVAYLHLECIDLALRTGTKLRLFHKEHDIFRFTLMVRAVALQAVGDMRGCIHTIRGFDKST